MVYNYAVYLAGLGVQGHLAWQQLQLEEELPVREKAGTIIGSVLMIDNCVQCMHAVQARVNPLPNKTNLPCPLPYTYTLGVDHMICSTVSLV